MMATCLVSVHADHYSASTPLNLSKVIYTPSGSSKGGRIRFYKTGLFKVFLKNLKLSQVTNGKSGFLMYSWMYNLQ